MEKLKPCPFQCNLEQLNDRINNLSYGISQMSGNCMQVNKPFLEAALSYMEELLGMRREEESRRAAPESKRLIYAAVLTEEIQHLQIFIGGESLFTPAIKETVLRTIDEQPTVAAPENDYAALKAKYDEINRYNISCTKKIDELLAEKLTLKNTLKSVHDRKVQKENKKGSLP